MTRTLPWGSFIPRKFSEHLCRPLPGPRGYSSEPQRMAQICSCGGRKTDHEMRCVCFVSAHVRQLVGVGRCGPLAELGGWPEGRADEDAESCSQQPGSMAGARQVRGRELVVVGGGASNTAGPPLSPLS